MFESEGRPLWLNFSQVAIAGKWKIQGVAQPVDLTVSGSSVTSVQKPFGNWMDEGGRSWIFRFFYSMENPNKDKTSAKLSLFSDIIPQTVSPH